MAKYIVKFSCGHEAEIQLFGPHKERDRKIEWLEREGMCPTCFKEERENEKAKAAAEAEALEAHLGLPELVGTTKQVEWARAIRAKILKDFEKIMEKYKDKFEMEPDGPEVKRMLEEARAKITKESSSKWFIENRDLQVYDLVIKFRNKKLK